jgi:hypothetical protein
MIAEPQSRLRRVQMQKMRLGRPWHFSFSQFALFMCASSIACFCATSAAAAAAGISVLVDPVNGDDSRCITTFKCRSIAYAVQVVGASQVNLSSGIFNESTVRVNDILSLVVSGVPSSTFFDCSRRLEQTTGTAFNISNSTVTFTDITFQHCSNTNGNGGAVAAVDSSVTVSECSFINCSAASGGAMSVSATGRCSNLFLNVKNSNFIRNTAIGGVIGCPTGDRSSEPCSTWGGAVAAFEISNVSVTGCTMADNGVVALVPLDSSQYSVSRNAVAGGGCMSLLFRGNSSSSTLNFNDNTFANCTVDVSNSSNIFVGNGIVHCCA